MQRFTEGRPVASYIHTACIYTHVYIHTVFVLPGFPASCDMVFSVTRGAFSFPPSFTAASCDTGLLVLLGFLVCLKNLSCSLSTGVRGVVPVVTASSLLAQSSGKLNRGPRDWGCEEEVEEDERGMEVGVSAIDCITGEGGEVTGKVVGLGGEESCLGLVSAG